MSAAIGAPVTVMNNAGEGGAWGIALLAMFRYYGKESLPDFLDDIFRDTESTTVEASEGEKTSFGSFMEKYKKALAIERLASEVL